MIATSYDSALIADIRRGNRAAAAAVVQRYNLRLWRIARGILGDDGEAEEAVQDAYLRAFSSPDAFRGEASLGTWLARIVINEALRRVDRRRPTIDLADIAQDLLPDTSVPLRWLRRLATSMQRPAPKFSAFWSRQLMGCH